LLRSNITYSWHDVIPGRNDSLPFIEGGVPFLVSIPAGSYNSVSLALAVETAMDGAVGAHTVTVSPTTGLMTIEAAGATLGLTWASFPANAINEMLGWPLTDTAVTGPPGVQTGPQIVNVSPAQYLFLRSSVLTGAMPDPSNDVLVDHVSGQDSSIIAKIPVTGVFGDKLHFEAIQPFQTAFAIDTSALKAIDLLLTFYDSGTPINLNGGSCDFTFAFRDARCELSEHGKARRFRLVPGSIQSQMAQKTTRKCSP
jgi:hypothetical protein